MSTTCYHCKNIISGLENPVCIADTLLICPKCNRLDYKYIITTCYAFLEGELNNLTRGGNHVDFCEICDEMLDCNLKANNPVFKQHLCRNCENSNNLVEICEISIKKMKKKIDRIGKKRVVSQNNSVSQNQIVSQNREIHQNNGICCWKKMGQSCNLAIGNNISGYCNKHYEWDRCDCQGRCGNHGGWCVNVATNGYACEKCKNH